MIPHFKKVSSKVSIFAASFGVQQTNNEPHTKIALLDSTILETLANTTFSNDI
jgi:hypothetical protein